MLSVYKYQIILKPLGFSQDYDFKTIIGNKYDHMFTLFNAV